LKHGSNGNNYSNSIEKLKCSINPKVGFKHIYGYTLAKQESEIEMPNGSTYLETGGINIAEMQQIYWNVYCEGGCHI